MRTFWITILALGLSLSAIAQTGTIRGNLLDGETGEPILYGTVQLRGTTIGTNTDLDGFFTFPDLEPGDYTLLFTYVGYDSLVQEITLAPGQVYYDKYYMSTNAVELDVVEVSGRKEEQRTEVYISKVTVTQEQILAMPSTGSEPDIAQYLQVIPGVITTGDQGGQIYIRGGAPVQNKIMIDGMTIYNPFHSIGFFSVFETEIIQSADVLTGGFGAEHGGRISAVVDINSRDGNKSRYSGLVSVSPFQAKFLLEGPVIKFDPEKDASASFIVTGKHSLLPQTSETLYSYASDSLGLPFGYTDLYGKFSLLSGNGSKVNLFGFHFTDDVSYTNLADLNWTASGGGFDFKLVPNQSRLIVGGTVTYSNYDIELKEGDDEPRTSGISGFTAALNFTYFGKNSELNYGFEINGFRTDLSFRNFLGVTITETQNTTEIGGYVSYRISSPRIVFEPGLRLQYYASLSNFSFEPRIALKLLMSEKVRFKLSGGVYSQNLISTVSEQDIVNLFVGFLAGPEGKLYAPGSTTEDAPHKLQKAIHGIAGFEIDASNRLQFNIEPYIKRYTQLIQLNRNKLTEQDPNFATETGTAAGLDISARYTSPRTFFWAAYSLGNSKRDDGDQVYAHNFDRRHNINLMATYRFGRKLLWELGGRWNFGSGFPFTLTQGFYGQYTFQEGLDTDINSGNPDLGVLYDDERNTGRLPNYIRLDVSLKKRIPLGQYTALEITASVTNVTDRENIFYFDRIEYERVNQLPIMPSLGIKFSF